MSLRNKYNVSTGRLLVQELHTKDSRMRFPFLLHQEAGEA